MVEEDLAALASQARALLPAGCAVAASDPGRSYPLWPGEEPGAMIAKRAAEFSAGRHAARAAMRAAGLSPQAVPKGLDRAPIWPEGLTGSITHSRSACLAAVSTELQGLGLDLEAERAFEPALSARIRNPEDRVSAWPEALEGVLIFSAKEAAYKAQYALSRQLFGFDSLALEIGESDFTARFRETIGPFAKGALIKGRLSLCAGHVLTVAWL